MIKCLECGKETMRLQWTHFKYKCTGKFSNGTEYLKVYPDAKLVDSSLSKRTAVTKENLIIKYGEHDGLLRWDSYRKKQSISNSLEYKQEKFGWSTTNFDEFNKSRSVTLLNSIARHGEELGAIKWDEYCERQRYTTTKEYFVSTYGNEDGIARWDNFCVGRTKSTDINYIKEKYQVTREEAENILSSRLSGNYVSEGEKVFANQLESVLDGITHTYKTKQFCIWNDYTNSPMFYDIASTTKKKIIEYNGDYWHANPALYSESFVVKQSGKSAMEIRERDRLKLLSAENRGFGTFTVWERQYQTNSDAVMEELAKWWNDGF